MPGTAATVPASMVIPTRTGDVIALPLDEILYHLPNTLAALVLSRPGGTFSFSANIALEQLRTGAVRIPFALLRQSSPPGTFADDAAHDDALIDLSLPLVLAAIGPAGLARRPDQKRTEVPDDVTGVFGAKLSRFSRPTVTASTPAAMPKPVTPIAPIPMPIAPKPVTLVAPPATAPAPAGEKVVTSIEAVSGAWPDPVRQEIQQFHLGSAPLSIPVDRLEAGMKTGRVVFTWAEVAGWLNDPMPPTAYGQTPVELPLQVIAPLFLARHRPATRRKTVSVGENVPELFTALPRPDAPPPARPAIAGTALKSAQDERFWEPDEPRPSPPSPAPQAAAPNVLGEIFGLPSKTDWTPQDVAQRILALPGVAGALLASRDGLLVAGQLPAPLKAEIMAAFLPRIFTSVGGCMEEVQLGTLRALRLSAGQSPCALFNAGALYLAVLGRPGQTLPEPALERIAGQLAQQNH